MPRCCIQMTVTRGCPTWSWNFYMWLCTVCVWEITENIKVIILQSSRHLYLLGMDFTTEQYQLKTIPEAPSYRKLSRESVRVWECESVWSLLLPRLLPSVLLVCDTFDGRHTPSVYTIQLGTTNALHCTVVHCSALQCSAVHCTTLHCTAVSVDRGAPDVRHTAGVLSGKKHLTHSIVHCKVWSVQGAVVSDQCSVYSVQCLVYSVKCKVFSVKCWGRLFRFLSSNHSGRRNSWALWRQLGAVQWISMWSSTVCSAVQCSWGQLTVWTLDKYSLWDGIDRGVHSYQFSVVHCMCSVVS